MLNPRYQSISQKITTPAAATHVVWRAPKGCTVTGVNAYRVGGTGAVVNAKKNAANLLTANLDVNAASAWKTGVVDDTATHLAAGDTLSFVVVSVAGAPTDLTIQADVLFDADER